MIAKSIEYAESDACPDRKLSLESRTLSRYSGSDGNRSDPEHAKSEQYFYFIFLLNFFNGSIYVVAGRIDVFVVFSKQYSLNFSIFV